MPPIARPCRARDVSAAVGACGILFLCTVATAFAVPSGIGPGSPGVREQGGAKDSGSIGSPSAGGREPVAQDRGDSSRPGPTGSESRLLGSPRASKSTGLAPDSATNPGAKPGSTSPMEMMRSMWRTGGALVLVIGIAVALAWTTKRLSRARGSLAAAMGPGGASPSGVLEVLGRYPLSRGVTLVLLKIDAKVLLVSQSVSRGGASMQTLCEIDRPDQVASILLRASRTDRSSIADRFQSLLSSSERAMESELEAAGARQVFRSSSGDTVELASVSRPVPLARRAGGEGVVARREATDDTRAPGSSVPSSARPGGDPVRSATLADPAAVRGYSSVGASRPLTGAEQLRRRLDAWRDREERAS